MLIRLALIHFYTFCFVSAIGILISLLWYAYAAYLSLSPFPLIPYRYAKKQYLPQLATVIGTLRTVNNLFRERTSMLSPGVDGILNKIEGFLGRGT